MLSCGHLAWDLLYAGQILWPGRYHAQGIQRLTWGGPGDFVCQNPSVLIVLALRTSKHHSLVHGVEAQQNKIPTKSPTCLGTDVFPLWCQCLSCSVHWRNALLHCHPPGKEVASQTSQFPSFHPLSVFLWATSSVASAEAFAMFPPSAAHFPTLAGKHSLRTPGRCLSRSRQRFSLARNKTAFTTWGPALLSMAKDSIVPPCSWGASSLSKQVDKSSAALFVSFSHYWKPCSAPESAAINLTEKLRIALWKRVFVFLLNNTKKE